MTPDTPMTGKGGLVERLRKRGNTLKAKALDAHGDVLFFDDTAELIREAADALAAPPSETPVAGAIAEIGLLIEFADAIDTHDGHVLSVRLRALQRHPALAPANDLTWFWEIVDREGLANVPSDERGALALLVRRAQAADERLAEVRKAALEETAKICDDSEREATRLRDEVGEATPSSQALLRASRTSWVNTSRMLATQIRALALSPAPQDDAAERIRQIDAGPNETEPLTAEEHLAYVYAPQEGTK